MVDVAACYTATAIGGFITRSQTATIHGERDDLSSLPLERNTREDAA